MTFAAVGDTPLGDGQSLSMRPCEVRPRLLCRKCAPPEVGIPIKRKLLAYHGAETLYNPPVTADVLIHLTDSRPPIPAPVELPVWTNDSVLKSVRNEISPQSTPVTIISASGTSRQSGARVVRKQGKRKNKSRASLTVGTEQSKGPTDVTPGRSRREINDLLRMPTAPHTEVDRPRDTLGTRPHINPIRRPLHSHTTGLVEHKNDDTSR